MVSDDNVSSEDPDDECTMELPVYINCSQESSDQLHMFQYPLRPNDRPYGDQGDLVRIEHNTFENLQLGKQQKIQIDNFRLTYELQEDQNYNANAAQHRVS